MKRNHKKTQRCLLWCVLLIAALAVLFTGCGKKTEPKVEGKAFTVLVADLEGKETTFEMVSDKATVGEALLEEGLIAGEEGSYGLYVTAVNGIELDWERDQKYWAFYIDGEYALAGVDQTELAEGAVYSFKPEG